MIVTLAAMLGQIGTPGGGFGLSYHFANGGNPTRRAAVLSSMQGSLPGGTDAVDKIPVARIVEALENHGGAYQHNGMDRHFPDIRFIWWAGGANFTHHQDTNRLIRARKTGAGGDLRMLLDGCGETRGYRSACDHLF